MKQIILTRIFFFVFILFNCVLTMASPGSENNAIQEAHHTTISQDCKLPCDISVDGLLTQNSAFQVRIIRFEIPSLEKKVPSSKLNTHSLSNDNFRNQVSVKITQYLISNPHSSILFTGVLII